MSSKRKKIWYGLMLSCLLIAGGLTQQVNAQQMPGLAANQLRIDSQAVTIKLKWKGVQLETKFEPYSALLVPVKLKGCAEQFYLQFDLGAPTTLFYADKIAQIKEYYPATLLEKDGATELKDVQFSLGKLNMEAKRIPLKNNSSSKINWKDKKALNIIGTLGADFIENKIVMINYPKMELFLGNEIPPAAQKGSEFADLLFIRRSVILPATLNGKKTMIFFDTGASAYPLLTDRKTAEAMAADTTVARNTIKSWNSEMIANTFNTKAEMTFAGKALPIGQVTYMEGVSSAQLEQMMKMGIGGMTGNKIFLQSTLLLDMKKKKFGLIVPKTN